MYIHSIVRNTTTHFRIVVLEDSGWDSRFFAGIERRAGDARSRCHDVGVSSHARKNFTYTMKLTDGEVELSTDPRIGAGSIHSGYGGT